MKSPVVKRSIVVAGHKTSVSLEEAFWNGMKEISSLRGMTLSELVGEIDSNRQQGNLSSAIRLFVLDYFRTRAVSAERARCPPRRIQNSRTHNCASLDHDLIRLNRIMVAFFLFEHDLRANASRLSRAKTGSRFSGSCSARIPPRHALEPVPRLDSAFAPLPYSITSLARVFAAGETACVSAVLILAANSACVG